MNHKNCPWALSVHSVTAWVSHKYVRFNVPDHDPIFFSSLEEEVWKRSPVWNKKYKFLLIYLIMTYFWKLDKMYIWTKTVWLLTGISLHSPNLKPDSWQNSWIKRKIHVANFFSKKGRDWRLFSLLRQLYKSLLKLLITNIVMTT